MAEEIEGDEVFILLCHTFFGDESQIFTTQVFLVMPVLFGNKLSEVSGIVYHLLVKIEPTSNAQNLFTILFTIRFKYSIFI